MFELKRLIGERSRRETLIASFHIEGILHLSGIGRAIGMARIRGDAAVPLSRAHRKFLTHKSDIARMTKREVTRRSIPLQLQ